MDARRVERILRNLLGNALDHGEGRPVVVTIGRDDDAVAITVRDHGVGLRPGEAGLVFNRFWRGDPSRSRLTGGTGLGLAIAPGGRPAARRLAAGVGRARSRGAVPADAAAAGRVTPCCTRRCRSDPDDTDEDADAHDAWTCRSAGCWPRCSRWPRC